MVYGNLSYQEIIYIRCEGLAYVNAMYWRDGIEIDSFEQTRLLFGSLDLW